MRAGASRKKGGTEEEVERKQEGKKGGPLYAYIIGEHPIILV
jgi:hypothetical protein